jgi:hypothetical protein
VSLCGSGWRPGAFVRQADEANIEGCPADAPIWAPVSASRSSAHAGHSRRLRSDLLLNGVCRALRPFPQIGLLVNRHGHPSVR